MNKLIFTMVGLLAVGFLASGAWALNERGDHNFTGENNFEGPFKLDGTEVTATAASINQIGSNTFTSITNAGKLTQNGELEVNGSDIDINQTLPANEIDIAQTNATGQNGTPWINLTDAATGTNADSTAEASVYLNSSRVYAQYIKAGKLSVGPNAEFLSTVSVGTNLIVNGTITSSNTITGSSLAGNGPNITNLTVGNIPITAGKVIIGNASGAGAAQTLSGGATMNSNGVVTLNPNGAGFTNLDVGNIPLAAGKVIIGNASGAGAAQDISGAITIITNGTTAYAGILATNLGGAGTANGLLKANGSGVVSPAVAGTDYLNPTNVWGYPGLAAAKTATNNTVTITAKDTAGNSKTGFRVFRIWSSTTDKGTPQTNNVASGGLTFTGGTALQTVTADADYWYCSSSTGVVYASLLNEASGTTNYLMCTDGSSVSSVACGRD